MEKKEAKTKEMLGRPWLDVGRRRQFSQFNRLTPELQHEDPVSFINFLRIPPEMCDELITSIGPSCTKKDTKWDM